MGAVALALLALLVARRRKQSALRDAFSNGGPSSPSNHHMLAPDPTWPRSDINVPFEVASDKTGPSTQSSQETQVRPVPEALSLLSSQGVHLVLIVRAPRGGGGCNLNAPRAGRPELALMASLWSLSRAADGHALRSISCLAGQPPFSLGWDQRGACAVLWKQGPQLFR